MRLEYNRSRRWEPCCCQGFPPFAPPPSGRAREAEWGLQSAAHRQSSLHGRLTSPCPPQHMREAAERRQQLELEHEQALAVLNAKQQEIDLLQKVRGCAAGMARGRGRRRALSCGCGLAAPPALLQAPECVPPPWPAEARVLCLSVLSSFSQADLGSCLCYKSKWML